MRIFVLASVLVAASASPAFAVPTEVSFAGRLADADGPVDGQVDLTFRLFDGSTMVWEESHAAVSAADGLVFVSLGSEDALDSSVFAGGGLDLEIAVGGVAMSPRLPIRSVPYAVHAAVADDAATVGGQPPTAFAAANHDHAGVYLPLGATLACPAGQKATGLTAAGSVTCAADVDTNTTYSAGTGLALSGTTFGISAGGVTATEIAADACAASEIAPNAVANSEMADNAIGNAELADNAVGSTEISDAAIVRADINGTEPGLYQRSPFCETRPGDLSMSSGNCGSTMCAPNLYFTCAGSCTSTTPVQCPPTLVAYLLSPTIQ